MKAAALLVLISFIFGKCLSQSTSKGSGTRPKLEYWQIGLPNWEKDYAKEKIGKKYNLSFVWQTGCIVSPEIRKQVYKHNKKIGKVLQKQLGKDWIDVLYNRVDSAYTSDTTILHQFYTALSAKLNTLASSTNEMYDYRVVDTEDPHVFLIKAFVLNENREATDKVLLTAKATYPQASFEIIDTPLKP